MQTSLSAELRSTAQGQEADRILRSCVHCGFCTATCPTYALLGDELDSPRGRIYLIKNLLEDSPVSRRTQQHLDRCLTCRACESTCPSGVEYGRLLDIGRNLTEQRVGRSWFSRAVRYLLRQTLPYPQRMMWFLKCARVFRKLLPRRWSELVSNALAANHASTRTSFSRRVLLLDGCVQSVIAPSINAATRKLLARLGIETLAAPGCCGAVSQHLSAPEEARRFMRSNIDRWWPEVERGVDAIVSTASGCGVTVKEYGYLLRDDPDYAERAQRIAALTKDIVELIEGVPDWSGIATLCSRRTQRIAFQAPCTLQHGQKLAGRVEALLARLGYKLSPVVDPHLCCGSAGTYSILQPKLARQLAQEKIASLSAGQPQAIITANIGCMLHLQGYTGVPVRHWVELLAAEL